MCVSVTFIRCNVAVNIYFDIRIVYTVLIFDMNRISRRLHANSTNDALRLSLLLLTAVQRKIYSRVGLAQ